MKYSTNLLSQIFL